MLLYTVMPIDAVFPPVCDLQTDTVQIPGGFAELICTKNGRYFSRLDSTDPALYLRGPSPGDRFSENLCRPRQLTSPARNYTMNREYQTNDKRSGILR